MILSGKDKESWTIEEERASNSWTEDEEETIEFTNVQEKWD